MSEHPSRVVLLGPQSPHADVGHVVGGLGVPGPVALVTAGLQEWEADDEHLRHVLGHETVNLALYERAERVWQADAELAAGHKRLQDTVRSLRRAYNLRLAKGMDALMALQGLSAEPEVVEPEVLDALEAVRALDRHHASRLSELRDDFETRFHPHGRSSVATEREDLRRVLEPVGVVVVDGGHVPALLNRLRLFGLKEMLEGKTVVACSGGAMALAETVVLFHDSPPWGPGHAELGEVGLGLFPDVVPLPHGSARLRLDDPGRVGRMSRRFAPSTCVLLDAGSRLEWDGSWRAATATRLTDAGFPEPWAPAA